MASVVCCCFFFSHSALQQISLSMYYIISRYSILYVGYVGQTMSFLTFMLHSGGYDAEKIIKNNKKIKKPSIGPKKEKRHPLAPSVFALVVFSLLRCIKRVICTISLVSLHPSIIFLFSFGFASRLTTPSSFPLS
jgi:hypothetical protein